MTTAGAITSEKRRTRETIVAIAGLLSLLATILTLTGYGVTLSIEQFDLPHQVLFGSTLDLLDLSCWVVVYFFENISRISFWEEYIKLFSGTLWGIPVLFLIFFSTGLYFKFFKDKDTATRRLPAWVGRLNPKPRSEDRVPALAIKLGLFSVLAWITVPLIYLLGAALIICIAAFLIMAPSIGLAAGNLYISEYVVRPEHCAPAKGRTHRMAQQPQTKSAPERRATCVQVRNERGLCEQGRVIFTTTSAVLLFNPTAGTAYRVPTKDAVVETLGDLDSGQGCRAKGPPGMPPPDAGKPGQGTAAVS